MLFNSIGTWLVALINILVLHSVAPCSATGSYLPVPAGRSGHGLPVPQVYKVTRSVWLGAFVTGLILGWSFVAPAGYIIYHAPGWFSVFFHI